MKNNANSFFKISFLFILFSSIVNTSCKKEETPSLLENREFLYQFHNGQTVPTAPYLGLHPINLSSTLLLEALANGNTNITVTIENSLDGEPYNIHAHDAADPASTPNGTPYKESPNANILAASVMGNGGRISVSQEAEMSFDDLINNYNGFYVIHDPLQDISTTDIGTFLVVSTFARDQNIVTFESTSFKYDFNKGQLVADFAYVGVHTENLNATLVIDELANESSRVTVIIENTIDGNTYHTHAHDVADPTSTTNGTPYIESPNTEVFVAAILGNGEAGASARISSKSLDFLTKEYNGFFVIHDPLQAISTTDPTTFVILASFAR